MSSGALKMSVYFGERERLAEAFLAEALLGLCEQHRFALSVLLRGAEGFGFRHHLRTDRLLTLSEDPPMVAVAVDSGDRVEAVLPEVRELIRHGLLTLERARGPIAAADAGELPADIPEQVKLTVYLGRRQPLGAGRRPGHVELVELLRRGGMVAAMVLLGVDGTVLGERRRARYLSHNDSVPLMVVSIGESAAVRGAIELLGAELPGALFTLERVRICKSDGRRLAELPALPRNDPAGLDVWQKLTVLSGENARHAGRPLHPQLVRRLRRAGAIGATTLRGTWGFHGGEPPHGDSFLSIRRRVPMLTEVVDAPERAQRWFRIIDELTDESGLVTSEAVPALRAAAPGQEHGGLRLSRRPAG